jgi:DNA-binding MarR family transcriptional regulator
MRTMPLPVLPCLCSNFRRTSRALSQVYEAALRPVGLRVTQFTVLQFLSIVGREISQGQMGEMLAMDSTSLTRTLAIMIRQGWVGERRGDKQRGEDGRERWLRLADRGSEVLQQALPLWEGAQSQLRRQLGDEMWKGLFETTRHVASVAIDSTPDNQGGLP